MSGWFSFASSSDSQTPLGYLLKTQSLQRISLSEAKSIAVLVRITLAVKTNKCKTYNSSNTIKFYFLFSWSSKMRVPDQWMVLAKQWFKDTGLSQFCCSAISNMQFPRSACLPTSTWRKEKSMGTWGQILTDRLWKWHVLLPFIF